MSKQKVIAAISGWRDTEMLGDCVRSCRDMGLPVLYADGPYPLFEAKAEKPAQSYYDRVLDAIGPDSWLFTPTHMPAYYWPSEAHKKTEMADKCRIGGYDWVFFLDTDERLEGSGLDGFDLGANDYRSINIYRPDEKHAPWGGWLPRLLRLRDGLHFRPPMDFDVYVGDEPLCKPTGKTPPESIQIPTDVLRIRHEHMQRPPERLIQNGEYHQRRRLYANA